MIQSGANVNTVDCRHTTPLHYAAMHVYPAIAKLLIQSGANVNAVDYQHKTPLHYAAKHKYPAVVKFLIHFGATVDALDDNHKTPLYYAADPAGVVWHIFPPDRVTLPSKMVAILDLLIQAGAHINEAADQQFSALRKAAMHGNYDIAEILIEFDAHLDAVNSYRNTPLHEAVSFGHFAIAKLLIESGAHVNTANNDQETPLHYAISLGHFPMIKLLIESGANVNALNAAQHTPLYAGLYNSIKELISTPALSGGSIDRLTKKFMKLLCWFIYQMCTDDVSLSVENRNHIFKLLHDSYQSSEVLRQISPLFSWLLTKALDCQSKTQLIESILEYLNAADQSEQNALIECMDHLFLQKEILEKFKENFNVLKAKFSLALLEKLKNIARYRHAQNLKCKIFNSFEKKSINELSVTAGKKNINQLLSLTATEIESSTENIRMLSSLRDHLIEYCNKTLMQSDFIKKILEINHRVENGFIDEEFNAAFRAHIEDTLNLIKDVHNHLDYIIEKEGVRLESPTLFGVNAGLEILFGCK